MRVLFSVLCVASVCAMPVWASEVEIDGLTITHRNQTTFGAAEFEEFRFELPEGEVVLQLIRLPENCQSRPACPDTLSVVALPTGFRAEPMDLITGEGTQREIVLIPYAGF